MRKIISVLSVLILWAASVAYGAGNEIFTKPMPDITDASGQTRLSSFLQSELPVVMSKYFTNGLVESGGLHSTSASCTTAAFATSAFTAGTSADHVTANGSGGSTFINYAAPNLGCNCSNPGSDIAWVVISSQGAASLASSNFNRVGTSNYYVDCASTTQPTLPDKSAWLMRTQIVNGQIATAPADMRGQAFFTTADLPDNTHGMTTLLGELRRIRGDDQEAYVYSGCAPSVPSSSLSFTSFACVAHVRDSGGGLVYVSQPATTFGPLSSGAGTYWLAIHADTSSVVSGWTRASTADKHYLWIKSATHPGHPTGGVTFAQVTVDATPVITAVSDVAPRTPAGPLKAIDVCGKYGTLDDAIAAVGSTTVELVVGCPLHVKANATTNANTTVRMVGNGSYTAMSAVTVTHNGPFLASLKRIKQANVTWKLGNNGRHVPIVHPEWFGAVHDGSTLDTAALQEALDAGGGHRVMLQNAVYATGPLTISTSLTLEGTNMRSSELRCATGSGPLLTVGSTVSWTVLKNFQYNNTSTCDIGIKIDGYHTTVDHLFTSPNVKWSTGSLVTLATAIEDVSINESYFFSSASGQTVPIGVLFQAGNGLRVTNSYFSGNVTAIQVGTTGQTVANFVITGSIFATFSGATTGYPGATNSLGVRLHQAESGVIQGNKFDISGDPTSTAVDGRAINIETALGTVIQGNFFSGNGIATELISLNATSGSIQALGIHHNKFERIASPGYAVGNHSSDNINVDLQGNWYNPGNSTGIFSQLIAQNSATPNIGMATVFTTNSSLATTITSFAGCSEYKTFSLIATDANTTIQFSGANIKGNAGVDKVMAVNDAIHCVCGIPAVSKVFCTLSLH